MPLSENNLSPYQLFENLARQTVNGDFADQFTLDIRNDEYHQLNGPEIGGTRLHGGVEHYEGNVVIDYFLMQKTPKGVRTLFRVVNRGNGAEPRSGMIVDPNLAVAELQGYIDKLKSQK